MDAMRLRVFLEYTERYDKIAEDIPLHLRLSGNQPSTLDDAGKHAVLRYMNLCSEETYLAIHGYVDPKIWKHWSAVIAQFAEQPIFHSFWKDFGDHYKSNVEFHSFAESCISGKPSYPTIEAAEPDPKEPVDLEVFLSLTKRFDDIARHLPLTLRLIQPSRFDDETNPATLADTASDSAQLRQNDEVVRSILRYINLCSEELWLRDRNLISNQVWTNWHRAMSEYFQQPVFRDVWRDVRASFQNNSAFVELIDSMT